MIKISCSRWAVFLAIVGASLLLLTAAAQAVTQVDVDADGYVVQAQTDDAGRMSYVASYTLGAQLASCIDVECSTATVTEIPGFGDAAARGYVVDDVPLVAGVDSEGEAFLAECATSDCSSVAATTPLPIAGELFINSVGSLVVVETQFVAELQLLVCSDPRCSSGDDTLVSVPEAKVLGVALDSADRPVFLTATELITCDSPTCASLGRFTHGLENVRDLDLASNDNPVIGLRADFLDDSFVPAVAECADRTCNTADTKTLATVVSGRKDVKVVAGPPNIAIAHDERGHVILIDSELTCVATWNNDSYTLAFDGDAGRAAHLRIQGRWRADVTGLQSYEGTGNPDRKDRYIIRTWSGDLFVDVSCSVDDQTEVPSLSDCFVQRSGGEATIRFATSGQSSNLRRDGKWLANVRHVTEYRDRQAGENYVLVRNIDGVRSTHPCTEAGQPSGCTVVVGNDSVELHWTDEGDKYVIRRDGKWLATPGTETNSFTDRDPVPGGTYTLRARHPNGTFTDIACS